MKLQLLSYLLLATVGTASFGSTESIVREWKPGTPGVEFAPKVHIDPSEVVQIGAGAEAVAPVLRDSQPGLKLAPYILRGEVKYEKVGGTGFVEMWNVFPPEQPGQPEAKYFSRTLGDSGPMQKLQGTSAWREFMLPFNPKGAASGPVRLEFNVVLPDGGTVWFRNLRLTQSGGAGSFAWAERPSSVGVVAGILGAAIGILGGIIGSCIQRGKGRAVAKSALTLFLILGIASAAGIAWAILTKHWSWLAIFTVAAAIVFALLPRFRGQMSRFDEAELRRMEAADA